MQPVMEVYNGEGYKLVWTNTDYEESGQIFAYIVWTSYTDGPVSRFLVRFVNCMLLLRPVPQQRADVKKLRTFLQTHIFVLYQLNSEHLNKRVGLMN